MKDELKYKLNILGAKAKYDVCNSSYFDYDLKGTKSVPGVYYAVIKGKYVPIFKVLLTNICIYDCEYCENRRSNDVERAIFTPEELAFLTVSLYKKNYIKGLFLTSAVFIDPDTTMEMMLKTVELLRFKENFKEYIHMKVIPGASPLLVEKAGVLVDRLSINIELPSERSLKLLAPDKNGREILGAMAFMNEKKIESSEEVKTTKSFRKNFIPAGQTTQLIVGATEESDIQILKLAKNLYKNFGLARVYYSAYIPLNESPKLPPITIKPPKRREHRLYQADFLIRFYGFEVEDILDEKKPYLDENIDPKMLWALNHREFFPVEINKADYELLIKVPGIGLGSARKIIEARRYKTLNFDDLKKLKVKLKNAKFFITCNGKALISLELPSEKIKEELFGEKFFQPSLF